jgi:hypothetical protein
MIFYFNWLQQFLLNSSAIVESSERTLLGRRVAIWWMVALGRWVAKLFVREMDG